MPHSEYVSLEERQDEDIHEALVREDAPHQRRISRNARLFVAIGGGIFTAAVVLGGAIFLYFVEEPVVAGVFFGLLAMMLSIAGVLLFAALRVVWRDTRAAKRLARRLHPKDFPETAPTQP